MFRFRTESLNCTRFEIINLSRSISSLSPSSSPNWKTVCLPLFRSLRGLYSSLTASTRLDLGRCTTSSDENKVTVLFLFAPLRCSIAMQLKKCCSGDLVSM
ncbi:hypothetical protein PUN28_003397 [Cardiocondyla obscurior]|uniref:Uncharacterized protein n=1 Tax=Cardiocondyla obscurior TaxID=286306 RepID=A0AAW2GMH8_9HYME